MGTAHRCNMIEKELTKARIQMLKKNGSVFFATVLYSLHVKVTEQIPTAATDGFNLMINPEFFLGLNQEERIFVLAHETCHVILMHMLRMGDRDPRLWNVAGDYVINLMLTECDFQIIPGGLLDQRFKDMTTEEVYKELEQMADNEELSPDFDDLLAGGSDEGSEDEQRQAPPPEVIAKQIRELEDTIMRARVAAETSGAGDLPKSLRRFFDQIFKPMLPWQDILKRYLSSTLCRQDYSWRRPKRLGQTMVPTLRSPKIGDIDFSIDVSGSIDNGLFTRFISEVHGILNSVKPSKINLVLWDTAIQLNEPIRTVNDLRRVELKGYGGTEVRYAFEAFKQNKTSQLMVIVTDGELWDDSYIPEHRPVLWIVYNNPSFKGLAGRNDKIIHIDTSTLK